MRLDNEVKTQGQKMLEKVGDLNLEANRNLLFTALSKASIDENTTQSEITPEEIAKVIFQAVKGGFYAGYVAAMTTEGRDSDGGKAPATDPIKALMETLATKPTNQLKKGNRLNGI